MAPATLVVSHVALADGRDVRIATAANVVNTTTEVEVAHVEVEFVCDGVAREIQVDAVEVSRDGICLPAGRGEVVGEAATTIIGRRLIVGVGGGAVIPAAAAVCATPLGSADGENVGASSF